MKEKIYTIPVNDSFDIDHGCPFCYLENKLEQKLIDYTLGPSMMEPDSREKSNKTGFCKHHLSIMLKENKRLSFTLMLSTHLEYIKNKINDIDITQKKTGLFKKNNNDYLSPLKSCNQECLICKQMQQDMQRYIDVFYHMWEKDTDFRKKAECHKGLCVNHGITLLENTNNALLKSQIIKLLKSTLTENINDLKAYIDTFDYRSQVKDPSIYKETVQNAVSILRGKL